MTFNLSAARLNAGHSIASLANELGVTRESIRRLEDVGSPQGVHPATAKKVADYFGVQVTDLMPVERTAA